MERYMKVLLAEDDTEMRRLMARVLEKDGYEVVEAKDGIELLDRIESMVRAGRHHRFLVVSDIRMPGLSGMDVLAALRCAKWYGPVVLVTAFPDDDTLDEATQLGVSALLDKPFQTEALLQAVREARARAITT